MIRDRLERLTIDDLESIAREKGLKFDELPGKDELVELLMEVFDEEQTEREQDNNSPMWVKERKFKILEDQALQTEIDEVYPLSDGYNENRIVLLLRDPNWAFAYWDVKHSDIEEIRDSRPAGQFFLRIYEINGDELNSDSIVDVYEIPLSLKDVSWYINLPQTGSYYCIDLIALFRSGEKTLARSNVVASPNLNDEEEDIFFQTDREGLENPEPEREIPQRIISNWDDQFLD